MERTEIIKPRGKLAVNPANMEIDERKYTRKVGLQSCYLRFIFALISFASLVVCVANALDTRPAIPGAPVEQHVVYEKSILFGAISLIACIYFAYDGKRNYDALALHAHQKFTDGDVLPGRVISLNPTRIAVMADLGLTASVWVLKVIEQPLTDVDIPNLKAGSRVPCATYYLRASESQWEDLLPEALALATDNQAQITRIGGTISEQAWEDLETVIPQLPNNPEPGLYPVRLLDFMESDTVNDGKPKQES